MTRSCGPEVAGCACPRPCPAFAGEILAGGWQPKARTELGVRVFWIIFAVGVVVLLFKVVPWLAAMTAVIPPVRGMEVRTRHAQPRPMPSVKKPKQIPYWALALMVDVAAILLRPLWWVTDPPGRTRKPTRPAPGEITADLAGLVATDEHLFCGYRLDDPAPAPTPPARRRGAFARWWADDHPGLYTLVFSALVVFVFACAAVTS